MKTIIKNTQTLRRATWNVVKSTTVIGALVVCGTEVATAATNFSDVAEKVTGTFGAVAKMITAVAYVAGLGFAVGAILKFKQHKDNPTQVPVGTPIAMLFIAAALVFMPSILGMTGASLFSSSATTGGVSGVTTIPGAS